jgi:hypothetical protein
VQYIVCFQRRKAEIQIPNSLRLTCLFLPNISTFGERERKVEMTREEKFIKKYISLGPVRRNRKQSALRHPAVRVAFSSDWEIRISGTKATFPYLHPHFKGEWKVKVVQ